MRKWTVRLLEDPIPEILDYTGYKCISCGQPMSIGAKVLYVQGYFEKVDGFDPNDHVDGGYIHKKCHTQRLVTAKLLNT